MEKEGLTQYHTLKEELQHKSMNALFLYFFLFSGLGGEWAAIRNKLRTPFS